MDNRTLHPDLSALLRSLSENEVRFVVVGGYAMARAKDLDDVKALERLRRARRPLKR
jgi:hypothetical protein